MGAKLAHQTGTAQNFTADLTPRAPYRIAIIMSGLDDELQRFIWGNGHSLRFKAYVTEPLIHSKGVLSLHTFVCMQKGHTEMVAKYYRDTISGKRT